MPDRGARRTLSAPPPRAGDVVTSSGLEARFDAAIAVAREAGALARRHYENRDDLIREVKGVQDLVSVADREVEDLILRLAGVADASVVALVHAVKGAVPVALVAAPASAGLDEAAVKAFCLENGPAYAHPRRVEVVAELPLNGVGKVDRVVVRRMAEALFGAELGRETSRETSPETKT